ncbi:MAG: FAD-dependent oxidoreductase [Alphaproteobacteria bacterium]
MSASVFETPLYPYRRHADQDARAAAHHRAIVVGAGPVGLAAAIDLVLQGVDVVLLDDNDRVSWGSRAICFAKRTLEILDRLGCGAAVRDLGVTWNVGRVFHRDAELYRFDLLPEPGHKFPAFVNLQQYHLERILVQRLAALVGDLRGRNRVSAVEALPDGVRVAVDTPEGPYAMTCDWLVACDGAHSPVRGMLGLGFEGRVFQDRFLIADVRMQADFPSERWFWFDPPFNPGRSALLHKQPEGLWRIDLQLGWDADPEAEKRPERVTPRLQAMLGPDVAFDYEWISVYTFQCRRMARFRHGRVLFAGDAAHQVSPFGARGANSGVQDVDNLCWKLAAVLAGRAGDALIDSYDAERGPAAEENIGHSSRATDFITPKSATSRLFQDVTLALAGHAGFARALVNSGRLSTASVYDGSPLNGPDLSPDRPAALRPGAPAVDAPVRDAAGDGWLLERLRGPSAIVGAGAPADSDALRRTAGPYDHDHIGPIRRRHGRRGRRRGPGRGALRPAPGRRLPVPSRPACAGARPRRRPRCPCRRRRPARLRRPWR